MCFTTEIKEGKLAEYRNYHDNIFPEVAAGLRAAGVTQVQLQAAGIKRTRGREGEKESSTCDGWRTVEEEREEGKETQNKKVAAVLLCSPPSPSLPVRQRR